MRIHYSTAISVAVPFALITMFLVSIVIQARKGKVLTGVTGMIGEIGIASTQLAPEGQVLVRGEYWTAVADAEISAGARVRVKAVEGLKLRVDPA